MALKLSSNFVACWWYGPSCLIVHGAPFSVPRCDQGGLKDEKHSRFLCSCEPMFLFDGLLHFFFGFPYTDYFWTSQGGGHRVVPRRKQDSKHSFWMRYNFKGSTLDSPSAHLHAYVPAGYH
eukprot:1150197-Pelagomonas_calceolata.AAC.3